MPLLMIRNDITKVRADAIVNPANVELLQGSGTSRAIYLAAGEEALTKACSRIKRCPVGQAVVTSAFELDAKYIIHAVGPVWEGGSGGEEEILHDTYQNSLRLALKKRCRSVAFPLLSSGNLGFPKERAMKVAIAAVSEFLMKHEMTVYLVLYDSGAVSVSKKILGAVDEYIDDHYVEEKDESLDNDRVFNRRICRMPERQSRATFTEAQVFRQPAPEPAPSASKRSLDSLMKQLDETFSQMLLRLIDERGLKDSDVYKRANLDRRHFSKIRNHVDYVPTKKTVLALAIALELTLDETIDLLARAGYAFSNSSKFDVIIRFFLEEGSYDIFEINEVLFSYDQPILCG